MRTYLYLFLLILVTVPFTVHGQTSNNTFVPLQPNLPGIKEFAQSNSIPQLLNSLYKICIGVAATLAVLQIMRAGVLYMGGDSVTEKKDAKDLISASIIGLILVLSPVIVFSVINPEILSLKIGASNLRNASQPASGTSGTGGGGASGGTPQTQAICAQYTGSNLKQVPNPNNKSCDALLGTQSGWASVPQCCSNLPSGSSCCGYSQSNTYQRPAPEIVSKGTFNYHRYLSDTSAQPECLITEPSNNFVTKAECYADMNKSVATGRIAVDKDCDGKTSSPVPAAVWDHLRKLPSCPQ